MGLWISDHPATVGERNELEIHADGRARFLRDFDESKDQEFVSDGSGTRVVDDLMILKFEGSTGEVFYKLVLSGWQSGSVRAIFGSMYMYRDGKLYNGLPISFRRWVEAANFSLDRTVTEHASFLSRERRRSTQALAGTGQPYARFNQPSKSGRQELDVPMQVAR